LHLALSHDASSLLLLRLGTSRERRSGLPLNDPRARPWPDTIAIRAKATRCRPILALQRATSFPKTTAMPATAEQVRAPSPPQRARRTKAPRRRAPRPVLDRVEYVALRAVVGFLAALPLALALRVGEAVALLAWWLDRPHRRIGMTNLAIAFPERPVAERRDARETRSRGSS